MEKLRLRFPKIGSVRCKMCGNLRLGLRRSKWLGEKTTNAFLSNYEKTGCYYCLLLWASFAHFSDPDDADSMSRKHHFWIQVDNRNLFQCQKICGRLNQSNSRRSEIIEFHLPENTAKEPSCVSSLLSSLSKFRPLWWIESNLLDQRPWFGRFQMFRYAPTCGSDPSSTECMATVKNWLNQCVSTHSVCRLAESDPHLPHRVIDLGPEKDVRSMRLVETDDGKRGSYITLSHRWGGSEPCQLEKGNLRDRLTEIRLAELPPNFADAVHLTAELGVQYLWIDSLCIIQDDNEDWDRESAKMAAIYRDSYLTIAASVSPNCYHGFLGPRPETGRYASFQPLYLGRPLPSSFDQIRLRRPLHDYPPYDDPLDSRFWVVQEQLLSTRVVSYRRNEVKWQCKTCQGCECCGLNKRGESGDAGSWMRRDFHRLMDLSSGNTNLLSRRGKYAFHQAFLRWWRLEVTTISRKQLSRESDKLAALAGVASSMQTATGDVYLAGMWKGDLHYSLGWRCSDYTRNSIPATYRAPSWCWSSLTDMSLTYNIDYSERRRGYFSFTDMRLTEFDLGTRSDATAAFKVLDVQCYPVTSNSFGWVEEGAYLELSGYLFPASLTAVVANPTQLTLRFQSIPTTLSALGACHVTFLADTFLAAVPLHEDDDNGVQNEITPTRARLTSTDPSALVNCPVICLYYSWFIFTHNSFDDHSMSRLDFLVLGRSPSVRGAYARIGFCQVDVQTDFAERFLKDIKALERRTLRIF